MANIKDIFVSKENILTILEYIKQYVNTRVVSRMGNVGWNDLTDECKSMINRSLPTVTSDNLMSVLGADGKTYYIKNVMTGLATPSIATTSATALATESVAVSASTTSSGARLYYKFSNSQFSEAAKAVNPSNMSANGWSTSNQISPSIWTRGISTSNITATVYVAVVAVDSGLASSVAVRAINITRCQPAPNVSFTGSDYSANRSSVWNSTVPSGFTKQYSTDNRNWDDYGTSGLTINATSRKSIIYYFRILNDSTGEVSRVSMVNLILYEKQIYIYAAPTKYANAGNITSAEVGKFTPLGITTMSRRNQKFNSTSAYYPTIAIPSGYKFKFYVLGSLQGSNTYTKIANVTSFGNTMDVYIINSQQASGEHEIEIEVSAS